MNEIVTVNGMNTAYLSLGQGEPLMILHGWGSSKERWQPVGKTISEAGFRVIIPDIPGFGASDEPKDVWGSDEFSAWLSGLVEQLGLEDLNLLGHSHGGRIAIRFASSHPPLLSKLILCSAAGLKHEPGLKQKVFKGVAKAGKVLTNNCAVCRTVLYKFAREHDYEKSSPMMKQVMVKLLDEDLTDKLSEITAPALLIWGRDDRDTPLADGEVMDRQIADSELLVYDGVRHGVHLQAAEWLTRDVVRFIQG